MSSVQHLRKFISERLTAAAEEIFTEFEKTIVQYEEEIDRQRRLLDITWKPQINFHTADLPQQHGYKEEEVLEDQQQCSLEMNSTVNEKEPECPQIKKEEEELLTNQEAEQLALQQKTLIVTSTHQESDFNKAEPKTNMFDSHNCPLAESRIQEGSSHIEMKLKQKYYRKRSRRDNADNPSVSKHQFNTESGRKAFICDVCGKVFSHKHSLMLHHRIHTGLKPYCCKTCGKCFNQKGNLLTHVRTHTGEKLYSCEICGRSFCQSSVLSTHMRVHTGERPFSCEVCGKKFITSSNLLRHTRSHTGEKMYVCETCGESFSIRRSLTTHRKTHTGET